MTAHYLSRAEIHDIGGQPGAQLYLEIAGLVVADQQAMIGRVTRANGQWAVEMNIGLATWSAVAGSEHETASG